MYHTACYITSLATTTNADVPAILDEVLTRRNSHLIFTEPYDLLCLASIGQFLTRARFGNAALTQKGSNHIWPLERSATVPDMPQVYDVRDNPLRLPLNEEITIEATTDGPAMGTAQVAFVMLLAPSPYTRTVPVGLDRFLTRATAVVPAGTETSWTALTEITFERDLLNGVYSVVGANVVAPNAIAFRLRFPDSPAINGKQLRPGGLVQNAIGDSPLSLQRYGMGEWGRFHTFSPPEIQIAADAVGGTYEIRLDLIYLGSDLGLVRTY